MLSIRNLNNNYGTIYFNINISEPNVTKSLIEEYCQSGASMVIFDFNGLSFEQSRKMLLEIRQGVFNYSHKKNNQVPYSMTLVLDLGGSCITTGRIFHTTVINIDII